ncbi:DUF4395 domain-containing protein [Sutcliffiella rhizosphaerae]|uniref:DUF4395 domain-containing protein n=1 Tax=Sutcliffiella rhizosphaerae TaxID=2880967 RepID=A0ABM8YPF5_9BACI|nr:DUF4395 domain-containing protein [Sutcliffiella rhizosphaerae]CAG9621777.1 hypothetical protein BACCIP111883_02550 [Sutcliffiella rhizosphaerae]
MKNHTVPKPLVTFNQWFILISVILSLLTGVYWIMSLPLLAGLSGLLFKWNPVLQVARTFLKKPSSSYPQEELAQLHFNQTIAVTCLALSLIGFYAGNLAVGYAFALMVGIASSVALMGFCIGCFLRFQWQQYKYRRAKG